MGTFTKILLGICIFQAFLTTTGADKCSRIRSRNLAGGQGYLTEEQVRQIIKCEVEDPERRNKIIRDAIEGVDVAEEFKKLTGISIGAFVAILIFAQILLNVIIVLVIFCCCCICKCGVYGKQSDNNRQRPPAQQGQGQGQSSSGMWSKEETPSRNQNEMQN